MNDGPFETVYREYLTILPQASIQAIENEIAKGLEEDSHGPYTHVHILAHGVEYEEGVDKRFGLALHSVNDPTVMDKVSGIRLATALRTSGSCGGAALALPTVVTIASCQGEQQGSVTGAGASVAHALHEAGIPVVITSQFPLSFPGSIRMTNVLYHQGLVRGRDPRVLLNKLRRELCAELATTHDWASIIAYASLPPDLEVQLRNVQISQIQRQISLAFKRYDQKRVNVFRDLDRVKKLRWRLANAKERLNRLQQDAKSVSSWRGLVETIEIPSIVITHKSGDWFKVWPTPLRSMVR